MRDSYVRERTLVFSFFHTVTVIPPARKLVDYVYLQEIIRRRIATVSGNFFAKKNTNLFLCTQMNKKTYFITYFLTLYLTVWLYPLRDKRLHGKMSTIK